MLVTDASTEALEMILKQVFFIQIPVKFRKDKNTIQVLIDFGSEVNVMTPAYTAVLGHKVCFTAIRAQKIEGSFLKIFGIVIASF